MDRLLTVEAKGTFQIADKIWHMTKGPIQTKYQLLSREISVCVCMLACVRVCLCIDDAVHWIH
jgi:hypothetical protein